MRKTMVRWAWLVAAVGAVAGAVQAQSGDPTALAPPSAADRANFPPG